MNIPNILTIIRLLLIPVFTLVFFSNAQNSLIYSIAIFIIAGITDVVDGYIARKYNLITKIGTVLDPLADKLMLITVLVCLFIKSYIPIWIPIIVILKDLTMILAGILLFNKDIIIPSNVYGKLATFLFYISIFTLYFNATVGKYLLYIAVISTLIAFFIYGKTMLSVNRCENRYEK